MNKAPIYNLQGEQLGQLDLPQAIFGSKVNDQLINQAVRVYLSNQRQVGAKTQTRSDVSLTTKKAYRQKGTGNARHGAKSAPIYVGGGVAHGPTGQENYKLKLSKKMRRQALISALSWMANNQKIIILDKADDLDGTTQKAATFLKNSKLFQTKTALITSSFSTNILRAWGNLSKSKILKADKLNTYEVINSGVIIIDKDTVNFLNNFYIESKVDSVNKDLKSEIIVNESPKTTQSKLSAKKSTDKTVKSSVKKDPSKSKNIKNKN